MSTSPPLVVPAPVATKTFSLVGFLVVMELASGLTQGWISPLLSSFMVRYDLTSAQATWITTSALVSTVVCVPLLAKLGDLYGHKRLLMVAACCVALGSTIVAIAPSFTVLLIGRVLQGAVTAFLPLEFAIVRERAGDSANRAIGLLVGALTIGASLGLLFAGICRQYMSLSGTLWLPAILMILAVPLLARLVPETVSRKAGAIDWGGAVLLGGGLAIFLVSLGNGASWGWTSGRTLTGLIVGVVLLTAWISWENRSAHPLVELGLISRGGQGLPLLTAFLFGAHLFGSSAPTAVFMSASESTSGFGFGLSGSSLGASLLVLGASMFAGTAIASRLAASVGLRPVLVGGALLSALGYGAQAAFHVDLGVFLVWQTLLGLGGGLVAAALPTIVVDRAPRDSVGIVSGLYNTTRTAAGSVAGAVFAAVMTGMLTTRAVGGTPTPIVPASAYAVVWLICAGLAIAVAVLAVPLVRVRPTVSA
ncbi:MAG: MFS transporter [Nocardioides sp.]|uniref:MFS transporter n=1 Tax=Nocardioides sp. TaxID=35761 RepID=UPI0039E4260F